MNIFLCCLALCAARGWLGGARKANETATEDEHVVDQLLTRHQFLIAIYLSSWRLELAMLAGYRLWVQGASFAAWVDRDSGIRYAKPNILDGIKTVRAKP